MSRGLGAVVRFVIAVMVICVVARFLGITWADVEHFFTNGMGPAAKFLQLFKGIAHTPLQ